VKRNGFGQGKKEERVDHQNMGEVQILRRQQKSTIRVPNEKEQIMAPCGRHVLRGETREKTSSYSRRLLFGLCGAPQTKICDQDTILEPSPL